MARKQIILATERGSQSAANKMERFSSLVGLGVSVWWIEESGLYRVEHNGKMDFFPTENLTMIHIIELARVYLKSK